MQIKLKVTHNGTEQELTAKPVDLGAFETEHNCSITIFEKEQKATHLFWVAWHIARRTKLTTLDYQDWLEDLDDIEVLDEVAAAPLDPAPSPG